MVKLVISGITVEPITPTRLFTNELGDELFNSFVYCYHNTVNDKVYIGKTVNIAARKNRHRRNAFVDNYQLPFYNALRKYGEDKFEFFVLDRFHVEWVVLEMEQFYIKLFTSTDRKFGYNITEGGEGSRGVGHNENQKRINKSRVGKNNGNAKLTDEMAIALFNQYKTGNISMLEIANLYGVSLPTVERLLSGRSWKYLELDVASLKDIKRNNIYFRKEDIPK